MFVHYSINIYLNTELDAEDTKRKTQHTQRVYILVKTKIMETNNVHTVKKSMTSRKREQACLEKEKAYV